MIVEPVDEGWFRRHPVLAAGVALALYVAVFVCRMAVDGADEAISFLYVLPIALVAFAFGRRAGVAAGLAGLALFAGWAIVDDVSLSPLGWLARAVTMLLLGALVGGAADQQRLVAVAQRQVLAAELRAREAAEISDSIIQGLTVVKWSLEAGACDRGLEVLTDTIETAEALVVDLLRDRPIRPGLAPSQSIAVPRHEVAVRP